MREKKTRKHEKKGNGGSAKSERDPDKERERVCGGGRRDINGKISPASRWCDDWCKGGGGLVRKSMSRAGSPADTHSHTGALQLTHHTLAAL